MKESLKYFLIGGIFFTVFTIGMYEKPSLSNHFIIRDLKAKILPSNIAGVYAFNACDNRSAYINRHQFKKMDINWGNFPVHFTSGFKNTVYLSCMGAINELIEFNVNGYEYGSVYSEYTVGEGPTLVFDKQGILIGLMGIL